MSNTKILLKLWVSISIVYEKKFKLNALLYYLIALIIMGMEHVIVTYCFVVN